MELSAFTEFGIVIGLAASFAIIATKLKQPAILGYIIAGLVISMSSHFRPHLEQLELFSKVGITLLLFVLGLELNVGELKRLGKVAIITGLGQVILSFSCGYIISLLLGFSANSSLFIAIGLTFSSTIVVVKLLSQKKEMESLHGRISIGILLVQDFIAILLLIVLTAFGRVQGSQGAGDIISHLGLTLLKGIAVGVIIYFFVRFVLNPLINWIRAEREVLFMTVIAWALLLAAVMGSERVGFSLEIGGLIAGIALSGRFEHLQIESWTKPLRDFFLMLFFVILGLQIDLSTINQVVIPAVALAFFVIVTKPIIIMMIMKYLGYSKKVSFLAAISLAQVSEFSLIVAKFGFDMGQVNTNVLTLLTISGGITMTISSYLILYNEAVFARLEGLLNIFNFRSDNSNNPDAIPAQHDIVLFGCHRMGKNLLGMIPHFKKNLLIVDFDPKTVYHLKKEGYDVVYGDISDIELYDGYKLREAKIVISTIPSIKENKKLLNYFKEFDSRPITIITANDDDAAREMYDSGADFVIYPHLLGGALISEIISKGSLTKSLVNMRNKHLETLVRC